MRNVAVTEGDKVEAQIKFGWEIDAYPVNEVVDYVNAVSKGDIDALTQLYYEKYNTPLAACLVPLRGGIISPGVRTDGF